MTPRSTQANSRTEENKTLKEIIIEKELRGKLKDELLKKEICLEKKKS
jgi:putative transposase